MCESFEGLKKSICYLLCSFIDLTKGATERCSFKQVINFLEIESNNLESKKKFFKNYHVKIFYKISFRLLQLFIWLKCRSFHGLCPCTSLGGLDLKTPAAKLAAYSRSSALILTKRMIPWQLKVVGIMTATGIWKQ